jgi:hypothetical protein
MYINMWINMKRLTVIQDMLCYALFYVLDLCTLYKKQAERGCFFNKAVATQKKTRSRFINQKLFITRILHFFFTRFEIYDERAFENSIYVYIKFSILISKSFSKVKEFGRWKIKI